VDWAVKQRAGTLIVGDPRGVLQLAAGRVHGKRLRDWRIGHLMSVLRDKAEVAGITVKVIDERGTSSTCPSCSRRVPKPAGRVFRCPHCGHGGHRDLVAAANIPPEAAAHPRYRDSRDHAPPRRPAPARCRTVAT